MSDLSESDALRQDLQLMEMNDSQKRIVVDIVKAEQAFIEKNNRRPTHILIPQRTFYELVDHRRFYNQDGSLRSIYGMIPIIATVNEVLPCLL